MDKKFKVIHLDPLSAKLAAAGFEGGASKSMSSAKSMLAKVRVEKRKNQKAIENAAQGKNVVLKKYAYKFTKKSYGKI